MSFTSGAAVGTTARGYWIVIRSDRDESARAYSVRPDGSRSVPLFPAGSKQYPVAVSGDGSTIAYDDLFGGGVSVSRADGTGLRRLDRRAAASVALTRDGTRLAIAVGYPLHVEVMASDGSGRRRLASGSDAVWSPDGGTLA